MYKECTDADKFIYGLKKLADDTKMIRCETSFGYLKRLMFNDGSSIDSRSLLNYIGFNV